MILDLVFGRFGVSFSSLMVTLHGDTEQEVASLLHLFTCVIMKSIVVNRLFVKMELYLSWRVILRIGILLDHT